MFNLLNLLNKFEHEGDPSSAAHQHVRPPLTLSPCNSLQRGHGTHLQNGAQGRTGVRAIQVDSPKRETERVWKREVQHGVAGLWPDVSC